MRAGFCIICGYGIYSSGALMTGEVTHESCLPRRAAMKSFRALGFNAWTTGGGCMALGRNTEAGGQNLGHIMVTNGDADFPDNDAVSVYLGIEGMDNGDGTEPWFTFEDHKAAAEFCRLMLVGMGLPLTGGCDYCGGGESGDHEACEKKARASR